MRASSASSAPGGVSVSTTGSPLGRCTVIAAVPSGTPKRHSGAFIELRPRKPVVARSTELVVEIGAARVRVAPGFDPALLAAVVTALQGAIG
jgi:hypothetical protein